MWFDPLLSEDSHQLSGFSIPLRSAVFPTSSLFSFCPSAPSDHARAWLARRISYSGENSFTQVPSVGYMILDAFNLFGTSPTYPYSLGISAHGNVALF